MEDSRAFRTTVIIVFAVILGIPALVLMVTRGSGLTSSELEAAKRECVALLSQREDAVDSPRVLDTWQKRGKQVLEIEYRGQIDYTLKPVGRRMYSELCVVDAKNQRIMIPALLRRGEWINDD